MLHWIKKQWAGRTQPGASQGPHNGLVADPPPGEAWQLRQQAQQLVSEGNAWLDKGDWHRAEDCFAKACALVPQHEPAQVNHAYVLLEQRHSERALVVLQKVVEANPRNADAQYLLGLAYSRLGDVSHAEISMRHALAANPDLVFALRDLCMLLARDGRTRDALEILNESGLDQRQGALAHFIRGNLQFAGRDLMASEASFSRCVDLTPDDHAVHLNLANVRLRLKNYAGAAASAAKVLALDPHNAAAMVVLASACLEQGQLSDCEEHVRKAVETDPDLASAHVVLGRLHAALGNWITAIKSLEQAQSLDPRDPEAIQRLAGCHQDTGNLAQALQLRRLGVQIDPHDPSGHVQLGITLQLSGELDSAMASFRRALELDPACGEALSNLGGACIEFGDLVQARSYLEAALDLDPGNLPARSNLLFLLSASPGVDGLEYLDHARQFGARVPKRGSASPCVRAPGQPGVDRPLRVGLVSGDLRTHPVGRFLESTLAGLDPRRVQPTVFATAAQEDGLTGRLKRHVHGWHQVAALGDDALAALIRSLQLDILIDLSGHTGHSRLPVFAQRLAPVQVSWLGYWASTGLPEMDFILADPITAPPGSEREFSEQVWRLAQTRMCFSAPIHIPPVQASPAPRSRNGHLTFGSYQTLAKINDHVLSAWQQILQRVPDARLRLQGKFLASPTARSALQARLNASGIGLERVLMFGGCNYEDYLRSYEDVDLVLDTFPFTGGTTTCEALWMGVPTLTLCGQSLVARQGASLMTHAGLSEFVVQTRAQYIEWACEFAAAPADRWKRGAAIRATVQTSSVFDGNQFATQLEAAWLGMWNSRFTARDGNQAGAE